MRLLPVLILVAACQKAPPDAAAPAERRDAGLTVAPAVRPLDAVPLGGLHQPYASDAHPSLEGSRTALDLKSLVRSQLDYTLSLDTTALAGLDEAGRDVLLAQLAADPGWRVHEQGDVLVAARRTPDGAGGWTLPADGYHREAEETWRVLLRFGAWGPEHPWSSGARITRVAAGAPEATLEGFLPPAVVYEGQVVTALALEAPHVQLEVYEHGPEDARPRTAAALSEVPALVGNVALMADRIARNGHERMVLPPDEPAQVPPDLSLGRPAPGILEWRARVASDEPGWAWLRLSRDGAPWEDLAMAAGTREAIGHGGTGTFYLQGRVELPPGPAFEAEAEVWFLPRRGDARILLSRPVMVPAR